MNDRLKKILPYAGIVALFLILAFGFAPQLLGDKTLAQADRMGWLGISKEVMDYNEANPDDKTLWTNSLFSGMPTVSFFASWEGNLLGEINPILDKCRPGSYLFISLLGGFLLMTAFGFRKKMAVLGAIAITLCSYNIQIIQAGHNTKLLAISYMPMVLAAVVYGYRQRKLPLQILSSALFGIALSLQVQANHPQITYYLAIIVIAYAITELVMAAREKWLKSYFMTSALFLVVGICGIATVSNKLLPIMEYSEYSMRGGNDLEEDGEKGSKGLDIEYATSWSYGIEEMPNLMIPDFNGGSSHATLGEDSHTYKLLKGQVSAKALENSMPMYWGPQPFTVGPMYLGAVIVMLALLGLIISQDRRKWWLLAVSVFAILLAWGSHIMGFTEIVFKYLPLYNKFRTVSMALVILQITTPLLAVMGLAEILKGGSRNIRGLYIAAGITGGFSLLTCLFPGIAGNFVSPADSGYDPAIVSAFIADRIALLRADALRSFILIALTAVVLIFMSRSNLASKSGGKDGGKYISYGLVALTVLVLFDLWQVDKRYLNSSHFVQKNYYEQTFTARAADKEILKDTALSYRVTDLSSGVFNDAFASYFHKSIGGYSPAKLSTYNNLIEHYLSDEINTLIGTLNKCSTISEAEEKMPYLPVLSMLNSKYFIVSGDISPLRNRYIQGNAWFVRDIRSVEKQADALYSLKDTDLRSCAILVGDEGSFKGASDSTSSIVMTGYSPKRLHYRSASETGGLAVFSEIYYPKGWKAYIDGKEAEILCANYLLRALDIPAGNHEIMFEFDPQSFHTATHISLASSSIVILVLIVGIAWTVTDRRRRLKKEA